MDELLEQIFVFIPVALIVFFRFFYENGKRKRRAAEASGGRPRPSGEPVSAFLASLFGVSEEAGGRGPSAGHAATAEAKERAPLRQSVASSSRETNYGRRPFRYEDGAAAVTDPASERPFDSNAIEGLVARPLDQLSPDSKRPEAQREPGREGLSRIGSLSELKRAVVMAELLGAPKALREE